MAGYWPGNYWPATDFFWPDDFWPDAPAASPYVTMQDYVDGIAATDAYATAHAVVAHGAWPQAALTGDTSAAPLLAATIAAAQAGTWLGAGYGGAGSTAGAPLSGTAGGLDYTRLTTLAAIAGGQTGPEPGVGGQGARTGPHATLTTPAAARTGIGGP